MLVEFLAQNQFGFAVVVVSTGMEGDAQKDQVLTEARAMVIRKYLVENFGFDDAQLKTLGTGKQTGAGTDVDGDWGSIQILVFPEGTEMPAAKPEPTADSGGPRADRAAQATAAVNP
ncbi:MAG: OmpA family protein [Terracidiphilus sp.]